MRETSAYEKISKNKIKLRDLALIPMFSIFTAVCSQISLPLPFTPVPINLALMSALLSGRALGSVKGMTSQLVYILLGVAGLPVFASFQPGAAALTGPTGGFIAGYAAAAFISGLFSKNDKRFSLSLLAMSLGVAACYFSGTAWFVFSTNTGISNALLLCVFPFIPGDAVKIFFASVLAQRLKKIIFKRQNM